MNLDINLGMETNVLPTVENCLREGDGKFYSTQNAFRVHEWLRGSSTDPLVLEAVGSNKDGLVLQRKLGNFEAKAYAERYHPGWLLTTEQRTQAMPEVTRLIKDNIEHTVEHPSAANQIALSDTTQKLMTIAASISAFNASGMFFQTPFPKRYLFETLDVLDMLFSCVLTQRRRFFPQYDGAGPTEYPEKMYNILELDKVIGRIQQAVLQGFFPYPEAQAKTDGLMDASFFCQCAMAYSAVTRTTIPVAYMEEKGRVYYWAVQVIMSLAKTVPSMQVRPKPTVASAMTRHTPSGEIPLNKIAATGNVVNLFKKPNGQDETPT